MRSDARNKIIIKNCDACNESGQFLNPEYDAFFQDWIDRNGKLIELENNSHIEFFKQKGFKETPPLLINCRCH